MPTLLEIVQPETAEMLIDAGDRRVYPRRSFVFQDGEPVTNVLIIEAGLVKVCKTAVSGRSVVLSVRGPGAIVGELSILDGEDRTATVETLEDTTVLAIPAVDFVRLMEENRDLARSVNRMLAARIRELTDQVLRLGTADGRARLASKLIELIPAESAAPVQIRFPVSQKELAEWVGLSREAVVRALTELRSEGLIRTARMQLEVLDIDGLRRAAG